MKNDITLILTWFIILASCWLLIKRKDLNKGIRGVFWIGLFFYTMIVIYFTLVPMTFPDGVKVSISYNLVPLNSIIGSIKNSYYRVWVNNILGNILLFMPLGFLCFLFDKRKVKLRRVVIIGFMCSLLIEVLQIVYSILNIDMRSFDIDDLLLNTIGCILGYLVYLKFQVILKAINMKPLKVLFEVMYKVECDMELQSNIHKSSNKRCKTNLNKWGLADFSGQEVEELIDSLANKKSSQVQTAEILRIIKDYEKHVRTNCECSAMCFFSVCSSILYYIDDLELQRKLIKFCLAPLVMWGLEDIEDIISWIDYFVTKDNAYMRPTDEGVEWMKETLLLKKELIYQLIMELNNELPDANTEEYLT